MFEIILYIFAIFGIIQAARSFIRFCFNISVPAYILYPMYKDDGDNFVALRILSEQNLPLIVVKNDYDDTSSLEKEFLYADFVKKSELSDYLKF